MHHLHYGDKHVATRITGPRHNYLALTFSSDAEAQPIEIIRLPAQGGCEHRELDDVKIMDEVVAGVREGNERIGKAYHLQTIEYVRNDTGPEETYRSMAREIVQEAHADEQRKSRDFKRLMDASDQKNEERQNKTQK